MPTASSSATPSQPRTRSPHLLQLCLHLLLPGYCSAPNPAPPLDLSQSTPEQWQPSFQNHRRCHSSAQSPSKGSALTQGTSHSPTITSKVLQRSNNLPSSNNSLETTPGSDLELKFSHSLAFLLTPTGLVMLHASETGCGQGAPGSSPGPRSRHSLFQFPPMFSF